MSAVAGETERLDGPLESFVAALYSTYIPINVTSSSQVAVKTEMST